MQLLTQGSASLSYIDKEKLSYIVAVRVSNSEFSIEAYTAIAQYSEISLVSRDGE